jgi:HlyD family secretion protein
MKRLLVIGVIVLFLLGGAVGLGWSYSGLNPGEWNGSIAGARAVALIASGSIEAEVITVAAEMGGRVIEVLADDGDEVAEGDPLVRLDPTLLLGQREQAEAGVAGAQAALDAARAQLALAKAGARPEQVAAAESGVAAAKAGLEAAQAQREVAQGQQAVAKASLDAAKGQLLAAEAAHAIAEAQVAAAQAILNRARGGATAEEIAIAEHSIELAKNALWGAQAQRDTVCSHVGRGAQQSDCDSAEAAVQAGEEQVRIAELQLQQAKAGLHVEDISATEAQLAQAKGGVDAAIANAETARANVDAAMAALSMAQSGVSGAQAGVDAAQAQVHQAEAALDLVRAGARHEEIALLKANVAGAESGLAGAGAALKALDSQLERMTLSAPMSGIVLERLVNVGELAAPGAPLLTLANLDDVTLTIYVPEADLGRVSLGQTVEVTVDAYRDAFIGQVSHIASEAEFTPRNVQTKKGRVNMVFAVKVVLPNAEQRLKPGMPADAVIKTEQ